MKLVVRRPENGETDYEFVFGILFLPLLAAATWLISLAPSSLIPKCMLHTSFGIPCPTCGAYRSMHLMIGGHPVESWLMQPLMVTLTACCALYSLYSFVVVFGKLRRIRLVDVSRSEKRIIVIVASALLLANWIYLALTGV